jgi:hypothetical protein
MATEDADLAQAYLSIVQKGSDIEHWFFVEFIISIRKMDAVSQN